MSEEDYNYVQNDDLLSASKIFQVALHNIKENRENLKDRIKHLQEILKSYTNFVFETKQVDKFNEWSKNNG